MAKRNRNTRNKAQPIVDEYGSGVQYDPLGSYTGVGKNPSDPPVQDADDL